MSPCTTENCERSTAPDKYLCESCTSDLQAWLDKVPALMNELFTTMAKLDQTAPRNSEGGAGGAGGSQMPLRAGALEIRGALRIWVIREGESWKPRDARELAGDKYAGGFLPMLMQLVAKAERHIDNPMEKHAYGNCGAQLEHGICGEPLIAAPDAHETECPTCGAVHDLDAIRTWRHAAVQGAPLPPDDCREQLAVLTGLRVTRAVFKAWVRRGKLRYVLDHVRTDGKERRVFFVLDLLRTYQKTNGRNL